MHSDIDKTHKDKDTIDELFRRTRIIKNSADFIRFMDFIARCSQYSRYNSMLVKIQNEAVTFFGGVNFWKKHNRRVKWDARKHLILIPKGPVMFVYDIMDTEGNDSPEEFLEKGLGRKPFEIKGLFDKNIYQRALREAQKWGIKVKFKPYSYFQTGSLRITPDGVPEIFIKENMSDELSFSALIHELAHLFLGHTGHKQLWYSGTEKSLTIEQRQLPYNTCDLEAETITYLICYKLGLETRSAEYIAGYAKSDEDFIEFRYETVIKISDKIERLFVKKQNNRIDQIIDDSHQTSNENLLLSL